MFCRNQVPCDIDFSWLNNLQVDQQIIIAETLDAFVNKCSWIIRNNEFKIVAQFKMQFYSTR